VQLTTFFHIVQRFRMSGTAPLLILHAVMACTWTVLIECCQGRSDGWEIKCAKVYVAEIRNSWSLQDTLFESSEFS
jgi:hypothetical protein